MQLHSSDNEYFIYKTSQDSLQGLCVNSAYIQYANQGMDIVVSSLPQSGDFATPGTVGDLQLACERKWFTCDATIPQIWLVALISLVRNCTKHIGTLYISSRNSIHSSLLNQQCPTVQKYPQSNLTCTFTMVSSSSKLT